MWLDKRHTGCWAQISQGHKALYQIPNTKPIMLMLNVHPTSSLLQAVEFGHISRCRDDISPRVKHSGCAWKCMVSAGMIAINLIHGLGKEKNWQITYIFISAFLYSFNNSPYKTSPHKHQDSSSFRKIKPVTPRIQIWVLMFLGD